MPSDTPTAPARKPEGRSRVSNGTSIFLLEQAGQPIDGRTTIARRFRDILDSILGDLGGRDQISEGEYQLARRAAGLSVQAELQEAWLAAQMFEKMNVDDYVRLVNGLNRTFASIGLRRRQRDVTPSLEQIIEGTAA